MYKMNFQDSVNSNIQALGKDGLLQKKSAEWFFQTVKHNYSYNLSNLGRPNHSVPTTTHGL
jgi:hypothetical protein